MKGDFPERIPAPGKWIGLALLLVLLLDFGIRWHLREMPLERDEGEYAYAAQLLLHGVSFYDHAYNIALKLPGTVAAYAAIMGIFGQTAAALHLGTALVNLATVLLVFILCRRICGNAAAIAGSAAFALLSITPANLGLAAHATHFVMLPVLAGIILLQTLDEKTSRRRIFAAGLLLGVALVMKQSGAVFGIFAAVWIAWCEFTSQCRQWRRCVIRLAILFLGGLLPLALTVAIVTATGDGKNFWFWTFQYAADHVSVLPFQSSLDSLLNELQAQFLAAPCLWLLTVAGLFTLFFLPQFHKWRFFAAAFFAFSFLATCPGGYFRGHYFIQLFPAAGLCAALSFRAISDWLSRLDASPALARGIPALILAGAIASSLIQWSGIYFFVSPAQACREIYGTNPFPEAVDISRYIAGHSSPDDQIAVLGSEPEIYFYSRRRSASGYICTYPLVEPQPHATAMQMEMIRQIEQATPAYVVFVNMTGSWRQSTARAPNTIPDWWENYSTNYTTVGMADINEEQPTELFWDGQLATRTNSQPPDISIHRRK